MKSFFLTIFTLFTSLWMLQAQTASPEAIKAYNAKQYGKAAQILQQEVDSQKKKGYESAGLYYNLGNAYFRSNELAKAILYYERALSLDPGNKDIRHNIAYANTRIEDKIVKAENFFIADWFDSIENIFSSNAWAKLAIILFLATITGCFFFLFGRQIWIKKTAFYVTIIGVVLVVLFNIFAYNQKSEINNKNQAIVMMPELNVMNAPSETSKQVFNLHAGTKITINKTDGDWFEIEIENGNVGWIKSDKIEII